jgi:hypothetical protein
MPLSMEEALEIAKYGKYYRQEQTRSGNTNRMVFCDYCNRKGLDASWKLNNDYDLCNNCYIKLQHHISLTNTNFKKVDNNLNTGGFSAYESFMGRQNEIYSNSVSNIPAPLTINGVPYDAHNFPRIGISSQDDSPVHNMTQQRINSGNGSSYDAMFSLPLESHFNNQKYL